VRPLGMVCPGGDGGLYEGRDILMTSHSKHRRAKALLGYQKVIDLEITQEVREAMEGKVYRA
jgi:hypothetical protein